MREGEVGVIGWSDFLRNHVYRHPLWGLFKRHQFSLRVTLYVFFGVVFMGAFLRQYQPEVGYTKFIRFGDHFEARRLSSVKAVPRFIEKDSYGYDGQWYAQLAVSPFLGDPELGQALDTPVYRARRILSAWTAYVLGMGQAGWVIQAYAIQNVLFWLLLGGVMLHWLPPHSSRSSVCWFGCMGSYGVFDSCASALPDVLGMLCIAGTLYWLERAKTSRAMTVLAFGGLGRETALLAGFALPNLAKLLDGPEQTPREWLREGLKYLPILLPLSLWLGYVVITFGSQGFGGSANFSLPLAGYVGKLPQLWQDLHEPHPYPFMKYNLYAFIGMSVQTMFFLARPRWREAWWRVGCVYALLLLILGKAVWEGYPGSYVRVLVPLTFAFNVSLTQYRVGQVWFWPVWLGGNLSLLYSLFELDALWR